MPMSSRFEDHDREQLDEFHEDLALLRAADASFDDQRALYESRVLPAGDNVDQTFRYYLTADAMIAIGALSPSLIGGFYRVTGLPDPRAASIAYRSPTWNAIVAQAETLLRSQTTEHWLTHFRTAGGPCSRYHLPTEAMDDLGAVANGFVEDIAHPVLGTYRTTTAPLVMGRSPVLRRPHR